MMDDFENSDSQLTASAAQTADAQFVVDVDGFEGPLDLLLLLAREHKLDITKISILPLAEQYLAFIDRVRHAHLDLAAEYLVMAAWLAYLKSRLLLPQQEEDEENLDAQTQQEILRWRLARLSAMRDASQSLMARPRLGVDVLATGRPEGIRLVRAPVWKDSLFDLAQAYALQKARTGAGKAYQVRRAPVMSVEDAFKILSKRLQISISWEKLEVWLPSASESSRRSVLASSFLAVLIMAKDGLVELRQKNPFAPIYLRQRKADKKAAAEKIGHAA